MPTTPEELQTRIREIAESVTGLGPMLVGALLAKRNRKRRRDGSTYVSASYYSFQYRGVDGRRHWRRIPRVLKGRVQKLIEAGTRYQRLEREYAALTVFRAYCPGPRTARRHLRVAPPSPVFPLDRALGLEHGFTRAAREAVVRCAARCGSFAEGRELLARLTPLRLATSTVRTVALWAGQKALNRQEKPTLDIRPPEVVAPAGDHRHVFPTVRTMYVMMDGTGVPCTATDTAGVRGRQADGSAGSRELKVGVIGFYAWLDHLERPVPEPGSLTHVVSDVEATTFGSLLRRAANSRGYGSVPRVQVVGDGADWIANIAQQNFPDAIFTADFYHACEHLHALCLELHLPDVSTRRHYRRLKGLLFRRGAAALIHRVQQDYPATLNHAAARKELAYFQHRVAAMRYNLFRKHGLYIASGHAEAACRTDVARRCKQAGMHWRHHNAACICAILASLRSRSFTA